MKTIEKIVDLATGEETFIEKELTAEEMNHLENLRAQAEAEALAKAEAQARREAALSKLAALGLTADDLKALGL